MKNIHDPNWKYLAHFGYSKKRSLTYLKKENNLLVLGSQGKCNNSVRVCKSLKKNFNFWPTIRYDYHDILDIQNCSNISFLVFNIKTYNFEVKEFNFGKTHVLKNTQIWFSDKG